ncbi:hypothetical protein MKQ68_07125 [Chitinophaga horti]|uniref:Uncharacterized protein n=1 Tax=Chitinophaga horti TaxID=2920382 RepID=A0ABY6J5A6_9BACT|nr:hypothetical protein [Chitinophaga horti]UYQ94863.1 hypothetical protein MKQ68_07125 [Chitinophaga horti]
MKLLTLFAVILFVAAIAGVFIDGPRWLLFFVIPGCVLMTISALLRDYEVIGSILLAPGEISVHNHDRLLVFRLGEIDQVGWQVGYCDQHHVGENIPVIYLPGNDTVLFPDETVMVEIIVLSILFIASAIYVLIIIRRN